MRRIISRLVASLVLVLPAIASAAPRLDVKHVQGADAPWVVGWNEAVVTLDNADGTGFRGEVAVDSSYERHPDGRASVRIPVSLAAGESARLLIPFHLNAGTFPNVVLRAAGEGEVGSQALNMTRAIEGVATIVEIQGKEARGAKLVEVPAAGSSAFDDEKEIPPHRPTPFPTPKHGPAVPPPPGAYTSLAVAQVSTVQIARESGDPILPDISGGWTGAVLVVAPSDILARLQGRSLESLEHWVLAGGTIAIAVTREEDLRHANLEALLGAEARMTSAAGSSTSTFSGANLQRGDASKEGDDGDYVKHGLGEVWLLRRDPWSRTFDPKSPRSIYALWEQSRARRAATISLPAGTGLRWQDDDRVRKFLDPNHGFRPSLGIAAVLVVLYSLLVGPVAFARARKLGKPLSVLRATPLLALGLFVLLVGLGKLGKGFRGRARRLSVIELAGGQSKGSATTFHAFYVADPNVVEVVAGRPIDTVHSVEPYAEGDPIELDRGSIAVRAVRAHPWQTIVVAEEGARDLSGTIVLEGNGLSLTLINKTAWTLEHVVLHPETVAVSPARSRYFAKVAPGQTVVARDGEPVDRRIRPLPYHLVAGAGGGEPLIKKDDPAADAMDAFDALISQWAGASYPPGEPVPVAMPVATAVVQTSGGKISGLSVEREAIFIRVVGLGGGKGKGELEKEEPKGKEQTL